MALAVIIVIAFLIIFVFLFLMGVASINQALDEMYRDLDDRDQIDYIKRWKEEKRRRDSNRKRRQKQ